MKIGIPRALLYYRYHYLWEDFFKNLETEYIVSPDTNKEIVNRGMNHTVDEACLSFKIFSGHVEWLLDKCDYILVPRISNFGTAGTVCTRFHALYDILNNTFKNQIRILGCNLDFKHPHSEMSAFLEMGKFLGKKKLPCTRAYLHAKRTEKNEQLRKEKFVENLLMKNEIKILVTAHGYNLYDKYTGAPILDSLHRMGVVPIPGNIANKKQAIAVSAKVSETLPWAFNKELVGAIALYKDRVDGIILLSTFPCGPDSMANEIIMRRVKDKPLLNLVLDGQEGDAGVKTRLESFVDVIKTKKGVINGEY